MRRIFAWAGRIGILNNDNKGGPWGGAPGGNGGSGGDGSGDGGDNGKEGGEGPEKPRTPWGATPPRPKRGKSGVGNVSSLDDFLKKSRERLGDGGFGGNFRGRFPGEEGRPYWLYGLIAFAFLWVAFTSIHRIAPEERGVVTLLGSYSRTLRPGIGFTLPSPIERVQTIDFEEIRTMDIGTTDNSSQNLILTGDQNIIDLAYSVRWKVSQPELFMFRIANPEETIREVAESAMRAVVAGVSLDDAIGAGRSDIEQRVQIAMQQVLDGYGAGVSVQGIAIKQADPPAAVNEAFKKVSAAQQEAQSYINQARAYALQVTARAQGDAAAFDKVFAQYKLSPEVTRRRMYYETMERVLSKVDKTVVEAPGITPYLPLPEAQRRAGAAK